MSTPKELNFLIFNLLKIGRVSSALAGLRGERTSSKMWGEAGSRTHAGPLSRRMRGWATAGVSVAVCFFLHSNSRSRSHSDAKQWWAWIWGSRLHKYFTRVFGNNFLLNVLACSCGFIWFIGPCVPPSVDWLLAIDSVTAPVFPHTVEYFSSIAVALIRIRPRLQPRLFDLPIIIVFAINVAITWVAWGFPFQRLPTGVTLQAAGVPAFFHSGEVEAILKEGQRNFFK